jgi:phospholipid/cholesterol/gamma-HCH transport system permease protein
MMPCLVIMFNVIALFGGYLISVVWLGIDAGQFWGNMQASVHFHSDILNGIYKGIVFAFFINWVALYQGFYAYPSASGIGAASTRTVVIASVVVLVLDFILTSLMLGSWSC